jgi:signal transduction histidine kinase
MEKFSDKILSTFKQILFVINKNLDVIYYDNKLSDNKEIKIDRDFFQKIKSDIRYKNIIYSIFEYNFTARLKIELKNDFLIFNAIPIIHENEKYIVFLLNDSFDSLASISNYDYREKIYAIEKLTSTMVHDINNVIAGVTGTLSLMEYKIMKGNSITNEELSKYVNTMNASVNRITETLDGFRSFYISRATNIQEVDVNLLINLLKENYKDDSEIIFSTEETDKKIKIDKFKILEAVDFLIQNSKEAIVLKKDDDNEFIGSILLKTDFKKIDKDEFLQIAIEDNGIGIDKIIIDKIFEPYFTTKNATKKGLGLTLANYGVIKSGGFIHIESQVHNWTKVKIYLPILT